MFVKILGGTFPKALIDIIYLDRYGETTGIAYSSIERSVGRIQNCKNHEKIAL
ncbi:MAG: hypothetical protein AAF770_00130 [Bacteroidota bacterium]